jgi:hypothetical protein
LTPAGADVSDTRIRQPLPAGLRAGVQGLQVIQPALMGTPPAEHRGVESNLAAFVLHPTINRKLDGSPDIAVSTLPATGDDPRSGELTVKLSPNVSKTQRACLLLNELSAPADRAARSYSFDASPHNRPADPEETDALVFPIGGVIKGDYLVRVQVDGAASPLEQDADVTNPLYIGPKVTIP